MDFEKSSDYRLSYSGFLNQRKHPVSQARLVAANPCGSPHFSAQNSASPFGLPILSEKSHACYACSLVNALTTAPLRYQLFSGKGIFCPRGFGPVRGADLRWRSFSADRANRREERVPVERKLNYWAEFLPGFYPFTPQKAPCFWKRNRGLFSG